MKQQINDDQSNSQGNSLPENATNTDKIISYKGFDDNFKCRRYQYEVGKTYEHEGDVKACSSGFHACEYPLDVFCYYPPNESKFAEVEQEGGLSRHDYDSKVASKKITVKAELNIAGLIKAAIDYTFSRVKPVDPNSPASNSGYQGAASNSGTRGAASNSGDYGVASNSGTRGAASNSGEHGVAASFGRDSKSKSSDTGAIVCIYRNDDGEIIHIRASKVGDNGIKPDTWYSLDENGEFVEAE